MARKPRNRATEKQVQYIHTLAKQNGLRWAKPFDPEYTSTTDASFLIEELKYRFSLTHGLFRRDYIETGIFEVI